MTVIWGFTGRADQESMTVARIAANQMESLGDSSLTDAVVDAVVEYLAAQGDASWDRKAVRAVLDNCAFTTEV
jgi:hypothetical protein